MLETLEIASWYAFVHQILILDFGTIGSCGFPHEFKLDHETLIHWRMVLDHYGRYHQSSSLLCSWKSFIKIDHLIYMIEDYVDPKLSFMSCAFYIAIYNILILGLWCIQILDSWFINALVHDLLVHWFHCSIMLHSAL